MFKSSSRKEGFRSDCFLSIFSLVLCVVFKVEVWWNGTEGSLGFGQRNPLCFDRSCGDMSLCSRDGVRASFRHGK